MTGVLIIRVQFGHKQTQGRWPWEGEAEIGVNVSHTRTGMVRPETGRSKREVSLRGYGGSLALMTT